MSERLVYIGSFTKDAGGEGTGISLARQHVETGVLEFVGVVAKTTSPAFLARHPDGRHLYAVNETGSAAVTGYRIGHDGTLTEVGTQPTGGNGACHLVVHPSGRYVLTANYGSGELSVHPLLDDGSIGERTELVRHAGSGPVVSRQEGPHAHHIRVDPSGRWVLAVDLGIDRVLTYELNVDNGKLIPVSIAPTAPGAGPRHLAFGNELVYVAGELDSTVTAFDFDTTTGRLDKVAEASSTVAAAPDDNYPSEIGISDDARFLYVANRGLDLVTTLAANGADIRPIADVPTGGAWPRHLAVVGPDLYVANERSHEVTHFRLDPDTGIPNLADDRLEIPSPACILAL